MNRRAFREHTFKLVFLMDFHDREEFDEQSALYFGQEENSRVGEEDARQIKEQARHVIDQIPMTDELLAGKVKGWKLSRIGKAELAILRIAVYEMREEKEIPCKVSINEAVLLAQKYAGEEAGGFVNGVLAGIYEDLPEEEKEQ